MQEKKRNKLAGKHPSYDSLNMSEDRRKKKIAYDKAYHATTERKKYRAELNKKNKESDKNGVNRKGKDYDHAVKKYVKSSINRGRTSKNGGTSGDVRARG
jgi:hypothetical protein